MCLLCSYGYPVDIPLREVVSVKKKALYGLTVCVIVAGVWVCCIWGSHAVSVLALQDMRNSQPRIVIDPGHGGIDGGATSCTGKLESGYNLEIALRLRDLFHLLVDGFVIVKEAVPA